MSVLCKLFGASKQAYYKYDDTLLQTRLLQEQIIIDFVLKMREQDPRIGGSKLFYMYKKEYASEDTLGRDSFEHVLSSRGLMLRRNSRRIPKTTDSTHGLPTYPNKVWSIIPLRPNEIWVTDITYIKIWDDVEKGIYHFCYLALLMDVYTKQILGYAVGESLDTIYPLQALKMALKTLPSDFDCSKLIHHSDRGVQYASYKYVEQLKRRNIVISMTENGNPKHNAYAERINNTIKNEFFANLTFLSIEDVKKAVADAVEFYNTKRPHLSLDMHTPEEAAQMTGEIHKLWFSYRENAIKTANKLEESEKSDTFAAAS